MSDAVLKPRLVVTFHNGSGSVYIFNSIAEAYHYARNNVSYSKVSRIELIMEGKYLRPLWDEEWTLESQRVGLELPE